MNWGGLNIFLHCQRALSLFEEQIALILSSMRERGLGHMTVLLAPFHHLGFTWLRFHTARHLIDIPIVVFEL